MSEQKVVTVHFKRLRSIVRSANQKDSDVQIEQRTAELLEIFEQSIKRVLERHLKSPEK